MFYISRSSLSFLIASKMRSTTWASQCSKRNAGHSKWANIKHTKSLKDAQRAATFTKLGRLMRVAIREGGGSDPNHNLKLAHIIEQAKRHSMPSATVHSIIKSAQNSKEASKSAVLEFRGPGGCVIIADILTENFPKTRHTISTILRKNHGVYSEGGSRHLFDLKGVIEAVPATDSTTYEVAIEHAIEAGAEDVIQLTGQGEGTTIKTLFRFVCTADRVHHVKVKLQELNYTIELVDQEFIPHTLAKLNDSEIEAVAQLCDKLQENPDVVRLYDNIA